MLSLTRDLEDGDCIYCCVDEPECPVNILLSLITRPHSFWLRRKHGLPSKLTRDNPK